MVEAGHDLFLDGMNIFLMEYLVLLLAPQHPSTVSVQLTNKAYESYGDTCTCL